MYKTLIVDDNKVARSIATS